jgi:hypothetical protein
VKGTDCVRGPGPVERGAITVLRTGRAGVRGRGWGGMSITGLDATLFLRVELC